jgi:hypothetical protein
MTVLFDTNILIDISDHREPFYEKSLEVFTLAVNGLIKLKRRLGRAGSAIPRGVIAAPWEQGQG